METKNIKASRARSPNYPNYDLKQCMGFLEKLYKKYGKSEIHVNDAIIQMGHSPTSSTANRVLASMFSFGLLESRGAKDNKFVRLSKLAQEILLEEENSPKRFDLLRQAAKKDSSMQAIWEKWGPNIPHEDSIKKSLQLEMTYSPEGAKRFASVIVETYDFAHMSKAITEELEEEINKNEEDKGLEGGGKEKKNITPPIRKANLLLPGINREILISAPADLTDKEFELVLQWLALQKYGLVSSVSEDKIDEKQEEQPKENNQ